MKASSSSKSTAKAKTKPRIDSHEDALQKLQELQRQAETMDLSQAMAAMQAAKLELEKIKKAQQDAAERVSKAKEQLQEAEK